MKNISRELKNFDNIIDDLKRLKILNANRKMPQRWIRITGKYNVSSSIDIENKIDEIKKIKIN